jgi:N-acetylated-alpha-linked acidic dipeptidase
MGAADPTSGTVSLHEVIRGFGVLLKQGWKPLRTIVFASWDAEEVRSSSFNDPHCSLISLQYGLVGSTEYGEDFGDWISSHVVSYLNLGELDRLLSMFSVVINESSIYQIYPSRVLAG